MQEKIKYIKENFKTLPKATNNDGEFVIIAEKDEGGGYEEYKECLGVNEQGELIWSYLSGCSCSGDNDNAKVTDITSKCFKINSDLNVRENFNMEDFKKAMVGIEHRESEILLDEIPGCYKNIDEVMENAKELVEIKHTLKQIINMKGD